jgi:hypothetical protein
MPNSLGLYSLLELEDKVRRVMLGQLFPVSPLTGLETGTPVYDMIASKQDIDYQLNTALTLNMLRANEVGEDAFITVVFLSVNANQVNVALPVDILTIKEVSWKSPSVTNPMPQQWHPMPQLDQDEPSHFFGADGTPSWHRDGNLMVFDSPILASNPQGIRLRYVKWVAQLVNPTDVVQSQLARVLQEVIILEAATRLMQQKRRNITEDIKESYTQAVELMLIAAANIHKPNSAQMVTGSLIRRGFSGRLRGARRW